MIGCSVALQVGKKGVVCGKVEGPVRVSGLGRVEGLGVGGLGRVEGPARVSGLGRVEGLGVRVLGRVEGLGGGIGGPSSSLSSIIISAFYTHYKCIL